MSWKAAFAAAWSVSENSLGTQISVVIWLSKGQVACDADCEKCDAHQGHEAEE